MAGDHTTQREKPPGAKPAAMLARKWAGVCLHAPLLLATSVDAILALAALGPEGLDVGQGFLIVPAMNPLTV